MVKKLTTEGVDSPSTKTSNKSSKKGTDMNNQQFATTVTVPEEVAGNQVLSAEEVALLDKLDVPNLVLDKAKSNNKVVDWVLSTSAKTLAHQAETLFPGKENTNSRLLFYTWAVTVQNRFNERRNPKVIPLNLVGAAGYGKSALTYDFGNIMTRFLSEKFGQEIKFHILVKTLAGILDLTDVVGISSIQNGVTKIAPPEGFPMDESSVGVLFLDDYTRAEGHVISGVMELV